MTKLILCMKNFDVIRYCMFLLFSQDIFVQKGKACVISWPKPIIYYIDNKFIKRIYKIIMMMMMTMMTTMIMTLIMMIMTITIIINLYRIFHAICEGTVHRQ